MSMVTAEQAKNLRSNINIEGKIKDKQEPRTVNLRTGGTTEVCDMLLQDSEDGEIKLTLWGDEIEKVSDGDTVRVTNGYTKPFRGEVGLSIGKYGKLEINPQ